MKSRFFLSGIDCGSTVHRAYLLREIVAYFYDYLIDLNDILLMAYYNRPMCCQIVGFVDISCLGDETIFYATVSICVKYQILGHSGSIVSPANFRISQYRYT